MGLRSELRTMKPGIIELAHDTKSGIGDIGQGFANALDFLEERICTSVEESKSEKCTCCGDHIAKGSKVYVTETVYFFEEDKN